MFSGGLASFEVSKRVIRKFGKRNVHFWFFDTQIEDESTYKFLDACEEVLDISIERYSDGRNPWEVFRDERFIGNSRVPLCNRVLKREYLERLLREKFPSKNVQIFLGYEHFEQERMEIAEEKWKQKGYEVQFPLNNKPHVNNGDLIKSVKQNGLEVPRLYCLGFSHNNCGGACVQAGIKQWSKLYKHFPERFLWHEEQEQLTREFLNKDVSILRDRRGGSTKPLTLRKLRLRLSN